MQLGKIEDSQTWQVCIACHHDPTPSSLGPLQYDENLPLRPSAFGFVLLTLLVLPVIYVRGTYSVVVAKPDFIAPLVDKIWGSLEIKEHDGRHE